MNCYVLVEGRRTEKIVLRAWFNIVFPELVEVQTPDDIKDNNYFILAGLGYPSYIRRIPAAIEDIKRNHGIDHFIVWVDTEDTDLMQKHAEISDLVANAENIVQSHLIIANCCIETWLLGYEKMLPNAPQGPELVKFKRHYDVKVNDPELMPPLAGYNTSAQFHLDYLKHVFREHGISYTKNHPGSAKESHYFNALVNRNRTTRHLQSFDSLINCFSTMGTTYFTDKANQSQ